MSESAISYQLSAIRQLSAISNQHTELIHRRNLTQLADVEMWNVEWLGGVAVLGLTSSAPRSSGAQSTESVSNMDFIQHLPQPSMLLPPALPAPPPWAVLLSGDIAQCVGSCVDLISLAAFSACCKSTAVMCANPAIWVAQAQHPPLLINTTHVVQSTMNPGPKEIVICAYQLLHRVARASAVQQLDEPLFSNELSLRSAGIACTGLWNLSEMIMESGTERRVSWQLGMADKIVHLMQHNMESEECLIQGFRCLVGIGRPIAGDAAINGQTEGILFAVAEEESDNLSSVSAGFNRSGDGVGELIVQTIEMYPHNSAVMSHVMWASANLCLSGRHRQWLRSAGFMETMFRVMDCHSSIVDVLERCLSCLINLLLPSDETSYCLRNIAVFIVGKVSALHDAGRATAQLYERQLLVLHNIAAWRRSALVCDQVRDFLDRIIASAGLPPRVGQMARRLYEAVSV